MSSEFVSTDAAQVRDAYSRFIKEKEAAILSLKNVIQASEAMTKFQGPRPQQLKNETRDSMNKLQNAIQIIEDMAVKIKKTANDILTAGGAPGV